MKKNSFAIVTAALLIGCLLSPARVFSQQATGYKILNKFRINSPGGWDYITVDPSQQKIYASHGDQINVLDEKNGDSIGVVKDVPGTHGVAIVNTLNKGYISHGKGSCTSFDLRTNAIISNINTGVGPDYILYDPFSNKVFVFNGRGFDVCVIDPANDQVVGKVVVGERLESAVSDGKGNIYVNGVTNNEIIEFNSVSLKIQHRYKIMGGKGPTGLDMDRKNGVLFIGCGDNNKMIVMNANNGKVLGSFPIGDCDAVVFDPGLKLAYASNKEGYITVVKESSPIKFSYVGKLKTLIGARTVAIDTATHHLYLPTAVSPWVDDPKTRPAALPNTFCILDVGK